MKLSKILGIINIIIVVWVLGLASLFAWRAEYRDMGKALFVCLGAGIVELIVVAVIHG